MNDTAATMAPRPKIHKLPPAKPKMLVWKQNFSSIIRNWDRHHTVMLILMVAAAVTGLSLVGIDTTPKPSESLAKNGRQRETPKPSGLGFDMPISSALASGEVVGGSGKVVVLYGENDAIVGQIVNVPAENEPSSGINNISGVDNHTRRELLSIISKY